MRNLLTAFWVLIVFTVMFFWLPKKLLYKETKPDFITSSISSYLYATLVVLFTTTYLSKLHLFNWLTLLLSYFIWPICSWLARNFGQIKIFLKVKSIQSFLELIDLVEFGNISKTLFQYFSDKTRNFSSTLKILITEEQLLKPVSILTITLSLIVFSFVATLRFSQSLQELRLPTVESYQTLLQSWQTLSGESVARLTISSSFIAAIANISAIDPMQVIRLLSPVLAFLLIPITGILAWRLTNYKSIGLVTSYALAAYTIYWPGFVIQINSLSSEPLLQKAISYFDLTFSEHLFGGQFTLIAIILLLSIITWAEVAKGTSNPIFKESLISSIICVLLLGLYSPLLLIPTFFTMAVLLIWQPLGLWVLSILLMAMCFTTQIAGSNQVLPKELSFILPIALALLCGAICQLVNILRFLANKFTYFILILLASFILSPFLAKPNKINYLEYDITTRKTLEITKQFPRKQWQIVAPTEQFASSYGYGWYQDLAEFIDKYQNQVSDPEFKFFFALDTFIFVEKKPFATFDKEPLDVPFSTLTDPTYRHYRSLAGRASLEQQALTLCETYSKLHPEVKIYYEDDLIRIYLIPKIETRP